MFENYEMESRGKTMVLANTENERAEDYKSDVDSGISQNLHWLWKRKKMKPISKIRTLTASRVIRSVELNVILTCFHFSGN